MFLVTAYKERKSNLLGSLALATRRKIPPTALKIIDHRMAPVDNAIELTDSWFRGDSEEAVRERQVITLETISESAHEVTLERIKRGAADNSSKLALSQ